mmetsp:Transcript_6445/g.7163  ORF Transcript_6445/g.7163 Transcript_6445/m.7163 type:complete len:114 (-) Transcript_6445:104-445(-)
MFPQQLPTMNSHNSKSNSIRNSSSSSSNGNNDNINHRILFIPSVLFEHDQGRIGRVEHGGEVFALPSSVSSSHSSSLKKALVILNEPQANTGQLQHHRHHQHQHRYHTKQQQQ